MAQAPANWEEELAKRDRKIAELEAQLAAAMRLIETLQAQLKQNSSNSSRPPSSDPPQSAPKPGPAPSPRTRGAQPGHQKHERALVPPEQVTEVVEVIPAHCEHCDQALQGMDPDPRRHQVFELPEIRSEITEFRLHGLTCRDCGHVTQALLPAGVPQGQFGARLMAFVAACTGYYHLSRRQTQELTKDLAGIELSLGAVCDLEQKTSAALAVPTAEAANYVKAQPAAHADETGWRENKRKAWLWTVVTPLVAVFAVARSRGSQVAKQLLGETFAGYLHSDRWCGYTWVSVLRRQLCWAHLARHFKMFQDYSGEARRIGEELEAWTSWMFTCWHQVRDGTMSRAQFQKIMDRLMPEILDLLEAGQHVPVRKVAGMCREILSLEAALFTFVDIEGVEPTNNRAERALRPAVLWRKGSFGSDSEAGSRFAERMLTVVTTLRLQHRKVLHYLTQCCQAALLRNSPPSLLPTPA